MTGMYNALEKLRAAERVGCVLAHTNADSPFVDDSVVASNHPTQDTQLTTKEHDIHEKGLVSVLKQIHDELDAAVFDAYGWPHDLDDESILQRLVDLNHERAAEEARGHIRWLRPEFQNPDSDARTQTKLAIDAPAKPTAKPKTEKAKKQPWPSTLAERFAAVQTVLADGDEPTAAADVAKRFSRARKDTIEDILTTLVAVGQARQTDDGRYVV